MKCWLYDSSLENKSKKKKEKFAARWSGALPQASSRQVSAFGHFVRSFLAARLPVRNFPQRTFQPKYRRSTTAQKPDSKANRKRASAGGNIRRPKDLKVGRVDLVAPTTFSWSMYRLGLTSTRVIRHCSATSRVSRAPVVSPVVLSSSSFSSLTEVRIRSPACSRYPHAATTEVAPRALRAQPFQAYRHKSVSSLREAVDTFVHRHVGTKKEDQELMLQQLGLNSLDELIDKVVPSDIRLKEQIDIPGGVGEFDALTYLRNIAKKNKIFKSHIGMGYYDTITPPVLQRNVLEAPQWYTPYTPYQAEIAQGRLEGLLNFQTMVSDLTGLPFANASVLDEATAAAEAVGMSFAKKNQPLDVFVDEMCHPQSIAVIQTKMKLRDINVHVGNHETFDFAATPVAAAVIQYPTTDGRVIDVASVKERIGRKDTLLVVGSDLMALTVLKPPGELGADVVYGSAQRFGVPMGGGGPHAAFLSCTKDLIRSIPGRIIGVSQDAHGKVALRMALQTREQHIKRERASSNICTAQALLACTAGFYAAYHGPIGLTRIASRIHRMAVVLEKGIAGLGYNVNPSGAEYFDTIAIQCCSRHEADKLMAIAYSHNSNLRRLDAETITLSVDEPTTPANLDTLLTIFAEAKGQSLAPSALDIDEELDDKAMLFSPKYARTSPFLTHPVFNNYHSETAMLRYLNNLAARDYGLQHGMIPLGSCTMKLNAAVEMIPIVWPEFMYIHPFAPQEQVQGYMQLFREVEEMLCKITGFQGCTLQPNAGSQGELAGLMMIRKYHESRGEPERKVCLIPTSAHGTNPASVVMAGMKVMTLASDKHGYADMNDLKDKLEKLGNTLAGLVVTYPSTHGVFEEDIREMCDLVHQHGGQVYMDGANMNAQCGITSPAAIGADCCHLNLHKTFCIPHGGGGPGMGPVCVAEHLVPFLPTHPIISPVVDDSQSVGTISAAPFSSALILPISWMYIKLMGGNGMALASKLAMLHANYLASRLKDVYPILFTNKKGYCAHEFILDTRDLKERANVEAIDIAKRLQDYGFHAPTMSFPVPNTLMIEPTESETLPELERFIRAMRSIKEEIDEIEEGQIGT